MKKILLSATFMLASFGAFASNSNEIVLKSNNFPEKNNKTEVVALIKAANTFSEEKAAPTCTVTVNLGIISFGYTWEC